MTFFPILIFSIFFISSNTKTLVSLPKKTNSKNSFFALIFKNNTKIYFPAHGLTISIYKNEGKLEYSSSKLEFDLSTIYYSYGGYYALTNNNIFYYINKSFSKKQFSENEYQYLSCFTTESNQLTFFTTYNGYIETYLFKNQEITSLKSNLILENDYEKISFFYCQYIKSSNNIVCIYLYNNIPKYIDLYINFNNNNCTIITLPKEIGLNPSYSVKFNELKQLSKITEINYNYICSVQVINGKIQCVKIIREYINKKYSEKIKITNEIYYFLNDCSNDIRDFDFTKMSNEYLTCCSQIGKIYCNRLNSDFEYINEFYINLMPDSNLHSTKISYLDSEFAVILFGTYKEDKIFFYSIYFPKCKNINNIYVEDEIILNEDNIGFTLDEAFNKNSKNILSIKFNSILDNTKFIFYYKKKETDSSFRIIESNKNYEITLSTIIKIKNTLSLPEITNININYITLTNETYESEICSINFYLKKCSINCLTCENFPNNCSECNNNENYFKSPENNNECFNINEKKEEWFFDKINKKYYICSNSCNYYITLSNENLIDCGNNFIYYPIEDKSECWLKNTNNDFYYFNNINKKYEKCYERCKSCNKKNESLQIQNCLSCKNDFILLNNNCYNKDDIIEEYYFNSIQNKFIKCHDNCIYCNNEGTNENNNCIKCKDNLYFYHHNCYLTCPKGTKIYEKFNIKSCKQITNLNENKDTEIKKEMNLKEVIDIIDNNIEDFADPNNIIQLNNNYTIQIYNINDKEEANLKSSELKLSIIELNECHDILKKKYNLKDNDSIIMIKIEKNITNSSVNNVEFLLYSSSGLQLDTSHCKDVKINILKPLININFDINNAIYLNNLGINIFDPNDTFFNDICYSFTNENGSDVILKDRRSDYFENETFCEDNCNNFTIDYSTMYVNCECNPESLNKNLDDIFNNEITKHNFGNIKKAFTSNLFKSNIVIVKCYNYVIKWIHMNKNLSNWILLSFILIEIILFFLFLRKRLKPIKNYLYLHYYEKEMDKQNYNDQNYKETENNKMFRKSISGNPPIKNKKKISHTKQKSSKINLNQVINEIEESFSSCRNNTKINNNNNKNNNNNNQINFNNNNYECNSLLDNISLFNNYDDIEFKENNKNDMFVIKRNNSRIPSLQTTIPMRNSIEIISKNEKTNLSISNSKNIKESISIYKKSSKINRRSKDLFENKEIDPKFLFILKKKNDSNNKLMSIKKDEIIKKKKSKIYLTSNDYFNLNYEEALELDKRSFINIVWGYILEEQIICNTFLSELFLELRIIKIYFMIFSFCLELFLNAIFFTDDYISEMYHNDGVLDFFSSLPKSFYSLLVGFIIMFFLNFLSNSKNQFDEATENIFESEKYKKKVNQILFGLKIKLIFFFIINFLLLLFFWYYCSTFCAIYYNSQEELIKGTLVSIIISMLIPFPVSFIMALIRYIALKKKSKCLFGINYCIDKII